MNHLTESNYQDPRPLMSEFPLCGARIRQPHVTAGAIIEARRFQGLK